MTAARDRFDELFRANYRDVLAYAVRRCASRADAEDVVAETFAVAWRRIDELPAGEHARPWLFGTARLVRLNTTRTRRRQQSLLHRIRGRVAPTSQRGADRDVLEADHLARALVHLSPIEREVLQLRAWEQLSDVEIAEALDISPATARKRLQRARQRLAAALDEPDESLRHVPHLTHSAREAAR